MHVKGDGRWFVEILCRNGLIYPCGGTTLLAYAKAGVVSRVAKVAATYQTDGKARVFKFPVDRLDEVAAILKPRRRRTYIQKEVREAVQEIVRKYIEDHIKPVLKVYGSLAGGRWVQHYNAQTGEKTFREFEADPATVRHFIDRLIPSAKTMTSIEFTGFLPNQIYQMIQAARQK